MLAVILSFFPLYGVMALAQEAPTPTPVPAVENMQTEAAPADPTPTVSAPANEANANENKDTNVTNNNDAQVNNNVNTSSNTGGNEIIEPTPTPDPEFVTPEQPTPTSEPTSENQSIESTPTPTVDMAVEGLTPTVTGEPTVPPVVDEILGGLTVTPTGESQNNSSASSDDQGTVTNNNDTTLTNFTDSSSNTGNNTATGKDSEIITGEASANADVVNFVNTNLVGSDFWQLVINMFVSSDNDIDLTKIEGYQSFDPALLSVLAKNDKTGDGSINIALANFLSSYSAYNTNNAQVTNNVNVSSNTGDNQADGKRSEIQTGDATASANVFNLVNTNLVGSNWFFGIINMFKQQNGDLILPYELQYLLGEAANMGGQVIALNQNTGDNSQNQAQASSSNITTITNNNQASIENNVNVSSNTGDNTIVGKDSTISTGNAQSLVDLINVVNTNIYGSRWLLLAVNNYGNWTGDILGWWGNKITIGNTTYIWIKLPADFQTGGQGNTIAVNEQTGDNSQNQAIASQTTSLEVVNSNNATVENNVTVAANTGNNQIDGKRSDIKTGDAKASTNIANIVNTNIIGNNWFFGIINIFDGFLGNIIFPRPDLQVAKTINKQSAVPGEEVTYTLYYQDSGRLWAKNVVIEDNLPSGVTYMSSNNNGIFENNKIVWKFDKINSGGSGNVTMVVKVNPDVSDGTYITNCVNITTGTDEPNKDNNNSCANILITRTPSGPTVTPTQQPQPTATPGEGGITPTPTQGGGGIGGPGEEGQGLAAGISGNGQGGGGGSAASCTLPEAPKAPNLISAENISSNEVKLTWTKVDRATYYLVSYGNFPGHYIYGNPNVGNADSYTVGSLNPGETYYFVVSAVVGGDCPVAGPYSNELSNKESTAGVLGAGVDFSIGPSSEIEGELGGGISTEAGEVAGAESKKACPFWWIVLLGQTLVLGGFYGFLLTKAKNPRFWWLAGPILIATAYLLDRVAHTYWYDKSHYCPYEPTIGIALASLETLGFKLFKKHKSK